MINLTMPNHIFGVPVFVREDQPKMQLSAYVCEVLAQPFIDETNAWMRDFFGTTNMLTDGQVVTIGEGMKASFHMNPRTLQMLRLKGGLS